MNFKLRSLVAATLAGSMMMGFGANAMADSTTDIVNALISKGVLTEEEGALLTKGRQNEADGQAKALKKASKLNVSDAIDNATVYGDIRVRHETRKGDKTDENSNTVTDSQTRDRERYKVTLGVKTEAGKFYTDLALAMGSAGRSDNATFGGATGATNGSGQKEAVYIKRAMLGWKATDWLALEAGRVKNPLYTTPMVWDGDLTFEGLVQKANFKVGDSKVFLNAVQSQYLGDTKTYDVAADSKSNWLFAFQGGLETPLTDKAKAKIAATYTTYSNSSRGGTFAPTIGDTTVVATSIGTNDLKLIEIPAEISFKTDGPVSFKLFGDFVYNIDGDKRAAAACAVYGNACNKAVDDKAWLLGAAISSQASKKVALGDWSAKLWYQDVGVYSVDPNAVDSDFMDSKVNMQGVVLKTQYNLSENVFVNFAAGHGTRKNDSYNTAGVSGDIGYNLKKYELYQLDMTYKF
jgi:polyhydroxyalkanoate synthesis regulator phasin